MILPVLMGGVFAALLYPLQDKLSRKGLGKGWAAIVITLASVVIVLVPSALVTYLAIKSGMEHWSQIDWRTMPTEWANLIELKLKIWMPWMKKQWLVALQDLGTSLGAKGAEWLGLQLAQLPHVAMSTVIAVVSFYFFLLDGEKMGAWVRQSSFLKREQTEAMIDSFIAVCRSVMWAGIVSGTVQAAIFALVIWIVGMSDVALISLLVYVCSFVPVLGATPITLGLALKAGILDDNTGVGWVLGTVGIFLFMLDGVIRPWVLKGGTSNFHPLLAFVATIGGLNAFGVTGIFVGPILAALFVTSMKLLPKVID